MTPRAIPFPGVAIAVVLLFVIHWIEPAIAAETTGGAPTGASGTGTAKPAKGKAKDKGKAQVQRPSWASAAGQDRFGTWANFTVGGVTQRMRLIPPGSFIMGTSRADVQAAWEGMDPSRRPPDAGRLLEFYPDEHEVTLTRPFWLGDTPVTQELWERVTGGNPSRFKGKNLPVGDVSWRQCQDFFDVINKQKPGLRVGFPTAAQREYACHGGNPAQVYGPLDQIAWYLPNGPTTHPVGRKAPNAWGLFDMIGNMKEMTADWIGALPTTPQTDPTGPATGSAKVAYGPGYNGEAWQLRAAYRTQTELDNSWNGQGFRICAPFDGDVPPTGDDAPRK